MIYHSFNNSICNRNIFIRISKQCVWITKKYSHTNSHYSWIPPDGHETGLNIYNSLSKTKVPFKTYKPGLVTWYNCGPTVYDSAHIGHALCYVRFDIVRRILEKVFGLRVVQATGITDVDDKIIRRAQELKCSVYDVCRKYEKEFWEDLGRLNVLSPTIAPRVTEHVPQIVSFIEKIMANGHAYSVQDGSVYFNATSFGSYGKFVQRTDADRQQEIFDPGKVGHRDFALWKGTKEGETVSWDAPWGRGRPGWHIECSAMSCHIFGPNLDLHSGGIDLMFPHHENEEAQCCAHNSVPQWCNFWIHSGHLITRQAEKMSKSLKNTIPIGDFLQKFHPNLFRLICVFSHYRNPIEFSDELLEKSEMRFNRINGFLQDTAAYLVGGASWGPLNEALLFEKLAATEKEMRSCLGDDFDTKSAAFALMELIAVVNGEIHSSRPASSGVRSVAPVAAVRDFVANVLQNLGFQFDGQLLSSHVTQNEENILGDILDSSVKFRQMVKKIALHKDKDIAPEEAFRIKERRAKLLQACDAFRGDLNRHGIQVKDYENDSTWNFRSKVK